MTGKRIGVGRQRLPGWCERFTAAHGGAAATTYAPATVTVAAVDGSTATILVPYAPLDVPAGSTEGLDIAALSAHLARQRRIGLVLVRRGAHSVGVGVDGTVVVSSTDRHYVQGRTAAGGWSQQRYARRREGQVRVSLQRAAEDVRRVLLPRTDELDAVVLGGDRGALDRLRAERELAPVFELAEPWVLDVPEPRRKVLDGAARDATGVSVLINEAGPRGDPSEPG